MKDNLQSLLNDHQLYHSKFQQDFLITTRAGGTIYGQYKQALRELFKRYRGLKELYSNRELLNIDIEELEDKLSKPCANKFQIRRNQVQLAKKKMDAEDLNKNIQDTEREFIRFYKQCCILKKQVGELTESKRDRLDREMWEFRLKEMAYLDFITSGRLSKNTLEFIGCLPFERRLKMLSAVKEHNSLIAWYESHKSFEFSEDMFSKYEIKGDILKQLKE